uniref:Immunoglobulin V-set domain-containing protein n=1 Tax=Maylandia zebra TaxID=106582 RepID=A0A3P9BFY5_9CICH
MAQYEILYLSSVVITHFLLQFMFLTDRYPLTFQCPYPSQHHDNSKFLCKGDHRNNCTNVMSQSRFTVQDDGFSHFFLVMIAELETADAGTYWCGSDSQWRVENYTKVELSVGKVNNHLHDSKINRAESSIFVWTPLNMGLWFMRFLFSHLSHSTCVNRPLC